MTQPNDVEFDWICGYSHINQSFIYNIIAQNITGEPCQKAQEDICKNNWSIYVEDDRINVEFLGGPFDGCMIPTVDHDAYKIYFIVKTQQTDKSPWRKLQYVVDLETKELADLEYKIISGSDCPCVWAIECKSYIEVITQTIDKKHYLLPTGLEAIAKQLFKLACMNNQYKAINGEQITNIKDIDVEKLEYTVALEHTDWPCVTYEKRSRASNWPEEEIINKITRQAALLARLSMPVAPGTPPSFKWQMYFPKQESILVGQLNVVQQQCLVLLKIVAREILSHPEIITEEHLLHRLLWACERFPQEEWTFANLSKFFLFLIDDLLDHVVDIHFPNIMLEQVNMLSTLDEEFQDLIMKRIVGLRRSPVQPFYLYTDKHQMMHLPQNKPLSEILRATEENRTYDTVHKLQVKFHKALGSLASELSQEGKLENAYHFIKSIAESTKMCFINLSAINILLSVTTMSDCDNSIKVYEYLLTLLNDNPVILGNLACIYHAKYAANPTAENEPLKKKAMEIFLQAYKNHECSVAAKTDFCNFLYYLKDYKQVSQVYENIMKHTNLIGQYNHYTLQEKASFDSHVREIIEHVGDINVSSFLYASYMQIESLLKQKKEGSQPVLEQFKIHLYQLDYSAVAYLLYAYAARDIGRIQDCLTALCSIAEDPKTDGIIGNLKATCQTFVQENPERRDEILQGIDGRDNIFVIINALLHLQLEEEDCYQKALSKVNTIIVDLGEDDTTTFCDVPVINADIAHLIHLIGGKDFAVKVMAYYLKCFCLVSVKKFEITMTVLEELEKYCLNMCGSFSKTACITNFLLHAYATLHVLKSQYEDDSRVQEDGNTQGTSENESSKKCEDESKSILIANARKSIKFALHYLKDQKQEKSLYVEEIIILSHFRCLHICENVVYSDIDLEELAREATKWEDEDDSDDEVPPSDSDVNSTVVSPKVQVYSRDADEFTEAHGNVD